MSGCDEPCGCTAAALTYGSKNEFGRRQRSSPKSLRSTWARSILVCIISYRSTKNSSSIGRRRTSKPRATWSFAIASRRCARHRLRPQRGSPQPSVRAVLHDEARTLRDGAAHLPHIEAHGGQLWAIPNEPRGAVFQFTLPLGQSD
jgi:hypothetical protein